jgi:hypothetical protein
MLERIEAILIQHKGKANAITSKEISKIIGYPMEDTQAATRKAIWKTAEQFGLPLVSSNKGYFIAETDDEIEAYNSNIQSRIDGMKATMERANRNYREWKQ